MAAPEAPVCYAGVQRESAAFRLMKQMVISSSLYFFSSDHVAFFASSAEIDIVVAVKWLDLGFDVN